MIVISFILLIMCDMPLRVDTSCASHTFKYLGNVTDKYSQLSSLKIKPIMFEMHSKTAVKIQIRNINEF